MSFCLTLDKRMYLWDIRSREAPHIFKRNGIYYYGSSKTAGIQSSGTSYYTATNLSGPWSAAKPRATPGPTTLGIRKSTLSTPSTARKGRFTCLPATAGAAQGRNGDYVWLPMEFEGDVPKVNYYQDWEVNLGTADLEKVRRLAVQNQDLTRAIATPFKDYRVKLSIRP